MEKLPDIDLESGLIGLERDSVSYSGAEHHLGALHKVVHTIFQSWHESFLVDQIEINSLIRGHLDPDVTFDKIDLASHLLKVVVLLPKASFFVNFEEKDGAGGSNDQSLVEEQVHGSQVGGGDQLKLNFGWLFGAEGETVALPVEGVAIVRDWAVE